MEPLQGKVAADVYSNIELTEDDFYSRHSCDWLRYFRALADKRWPLLNHLKYTLQNMKTYGPPKYYDQNRRIVSSERRCNERDHPRNRNLPET